MESFWGDIGMDDKDYYEGYEVLATPSWISEYDLVIPRVYNLTFA